MIVDDTEAKAPLGIRRLEAYPMSVPDECLVGILELLRGLHDIIFRYLNDSRSLQGRKIYLVPDHVSKGSAVRYVKELSGSSFVFAAGDSLLDESMLELADEAMAPNHGELYRKYGVHKHIGFTENSGIRASDEILARLTNRMEVRKAL